MKNKFRNPAFWLVDGVAIDYVECDTETNTCTAVMANGDRLPCPNIDVHFAERAVADGKWTKDEVVS